MEYVHGIHVQRAGRKSFNSVMEECIFQQEQGVMRGCCYITTCWPITHMQVHVSGRIPWSEYRVALCWLCDHFGSNATDKQSTAAVVERRTVYSVLRCLCVWENFTSWFIFIFPPVPVATRPHQRSSLEFFPSRSNEMIHSWLTLMWKLSGYTKGWSFFKRLLREKIFQEAVSLILSGLT